MNLIRATALVGSLVGTATFAIPAHAQMGGSDGPHINLLADSPSKTPEEADRDRARDKAYKDTLKAIPDAKASNDPWGNVRSEAPKSAAKPATPKAAAAKPKAKTSTNAAN